VELFRLIYYPGFLIAIFLCRPLGRIFFIPMILDLLFDMSFQFHVWGDVDRRWLFMAYDFALFVWVLVLSGVTSKPTFAAVVLADAAFILYSIWPQFQTAAIGDDIGRTAGQAIWDIWDISIVMVIASVMIASTVGARLKGRMVDVLTNPKKRFLIPIGLFLGYGLFAKYFAFCLPEAVVKYRYQVAGELLVWGWVAFELPFFLMYRRLRRQTE
jgi:hypothetical protein